MDNAPTTRENDAPSQTRNAINAWGFIGMSIAAVAWIANYLSMNTLTVGEFALRQGLVMIAVLPRLILFATYVPILLGIAGLFLARNRERYSSIVCLVLAIAGICWLQWMKAQHRYRADRAEVIASKVEAYAQVHGKYPQSLSDINELTDSDRAMVVLVPGVSPGEKVTFTPSLLGRPMPFMKAESHRIVFYLKHVVYGYRVIYGSNGKLVTVSTTEDFNSIINASR